MFVRMTYPKKEYHKSRSLTTQRPARSKRAAGGAEKVLVIAAATRQASFLPIKVLSELAHSAVPGMAGMSRRDARPRPWSLPGCIRDLARERRSADLYQKSKEETSDAYKTGAGR
ncbi:MAG: hypothetical protein PVI28_17345, partial [Gammaproteobacteria bacterium]